MTELIAVVVPKELYYHEIAYVRGLEARVAVLEAGERYWNGVYKIILDERDALRARVAKLEATLLEARGWVQDDVNLDHRHRGQDVLDRIDAALMDAPQ